MRIDIVCQVVDNYGDIAVVWRLAQALLQDDPDVGIRLLVDDTEAFRALCPSVDSRAVQTVACSGGSVLVIHSRRLEAVDDQRRQPADVLVEAFGAPTPVVWLEAFLVAASAGPPRTILHLEYLTAEAWSEEYHLLPSPVGRPGVSRYFFVPGFRPRTGGLVFTDPATVGASVAAARGSEEWLMTLFSYEHDFTRFWEDLIDFLAERQQRARVIVFAGRSRSGALGSWERVCERRGRPATITVVDQPFVSQDEYTALVAAGDFHVVRGEESWVQAVLSGKAFLWQAYLQPEGHQRVKVEALLEVWRPWFEAEAGLGVFEAVAREFRAFNDRLVNSELEPPLEGYRVFWENRELLERVGRSWSSHLRKNAKLSRRMLDFLKKDRV